MEEKQKDIEKEQDEQMENASILVVDDNSEIREIIQVLLEGEGYEVFQASSGEEALRCQGKQEFDLIILDIMMPGANGYQVCRKIRETSNAPILFLSARTKDSDKTLGFSSGGDDYLAKPFSYNELINRSKALIRRYQVYKGKDVKKQTESHVIQYQNITLDEEKRKVYADGKALELTETEYRMLLLMVKNRGQIFSAQRLFEAVWEEDYYYGASNTVMVHIRNLRSKVEKNPKQPVLIKTVWGKGYCCE